MQDAAHGATAEGTVHESVGFPPFKIETFPSQIFWLAVTFVLLFVFMWRIALPRIGGAIANRREAINGDLAAAERSNAEAQAASAGYESALAAARNRAHAIAEETRKTVRTAIESEKAAADAQAHAQIAEAEARIAATRGEARGHVTRAAEDAAIEIVRVLTGDTVPAAEAAAAVASVSRS